MPDHTHALVTLFSVAQFFRIVNAVFLSYRRPRQTGTDGFLDGHIDGMILVISGHFLNQRVARGAGGLKDNEVAY